MRLQEDQSKAYAMRLSTLKILILITISIDLSRIARGEPSGSLSAAVTK
jgi:hypothetical protein